MKNDKMQQEIMVVKNSILFKNTQRKTQFYKNSECDFEQAILENFEYMKRGMAEVNFTYKQPIPYGVVINEKNEIFVYTRGGSDSNAGEKRLYNKIAIGVGGHLEKEKIIVDNPIKDGLLREIREEIGLESKNIVSISTIGYLNNESNEVNKVHIGIVYIIHISSAAKLQLLDGELEKGGFLTINEYERRCGLQKYDIEPWSLLLLGPLHEYFKAKKIKDHLCELANKGFILSDKEKCKEYLKKVGLHRLKRYFNVVNTYKGQDFQTIIDAYNFDKDIRLLNLQIIEIIEKYLKNIFTLDIGNPLNKDLYIPKNKLGNKYKVKKRLVYNERKIVSLKYDDPECNKDFFQEGILATELFYDNLTFGEIFSIFKDLNIENQYKISKNFGIPQKIFESWIGAILYLRNLSSHGKNVFNKKMTQSLMGRDFQRIFGKDENSSYISYLFVLDVFAKKLAPELHWIEKVFITMNTYGIKLIDFTGKKEIPHIELKSGDLEAWEILVKELYRKYS